MPSGSKPPSTGSPTSSAREGDTDPVEVRRSKAIGILAQPAEALQLLCEHQDDDWDGPAEPDDLAPREPARRSRVDFDQRPAGRRDLPTAAHRSLQIVPPPFDPDRARPRAVVYVHSAAEALTAGTGIARVEEVGPILLDRLHALLGDHCRINLKPVIDLPAGISRSTATRSRPRCGSSCCSAIRPMCSPTPLR